MEALTWALSIISILGVTGTIVAIVVAPAVAIPIMQSVVSFLMRCKPCLVAIGIAALVMGAYWYGRHEAGQECRAAELAAELAARKDDLAKAKKSAADEAARADKIEEQANDQRKKDADYIASLEKRPACTLDDADLGGVRNDKPRAHRPRPPASTR